MKSVHALMDFLNVSKAKIDSDSDKLRKFELFCTWKINLWFSRQNKSKVFPNKYQNFLIQTL